MFASSGIVISNPLFSSEYACENDSRDGVMRTQTTDSSDYVFSLDDLKPGEEAVIAGYQDDIADEMRLLEMGLIIGSIVRLVKIAPFGDPIQIRVRGTDISLRRALAKRILTRPTQLNHDERRN